MKLQTLHASPDTADATLASDSLIIMETKKAAMTAEDQKEVDATMKLLQDVVCLAYTRTLDPKKTEALDNEYANAFGRSLHNTLKSRLGNACFQLYRA